MSGNYMKRLIQQGLSRAPWRAGRLWLGALVLLISALSIGLFVGPTVGIATAYPDGDRSIADAWARARAAGSYEFSSDIVQVTMPTARVTNVGRRSHSQQLRLEGHTDLRREQLAMTLWTAGGSVAQPESGVAIKVEDGKTFIRQGLDQWRESDSLTAPGGHPLAPGGDFLAFLSAVRDVQLIGHEQRAHIEFTRYRFTLDGPLLATYMHQQTEATLRAQGELPASVRLDVPQYYRDMTGDGELWVRADGLPLRQILNLHFPAQRDEMLTAQITTDFAKFGTPEVSKGWRTDQLAAISGPWVNHWAAPIFMLAAGLGLVFFLLRNRHSRPLYNALASALILSVVLGPLLSNYQAVHFFDTQSVKAAAQEEVQTQNDRARDLRTALGNPEFNPQRNLLESGEQQWESGRLGDWAIANHSPNRSIAQSPTLQSTDTGTDTDGDGLTDFQEQRIGTDYTFADSDEDGINDYIEVRGFSLGGQTWYANPLAIDSNNDGVPDTIEFDNDGNSTPDDTDGDNTPDLFDTDNDNDGVPDNKDLAPFARARAAGGAPFTENSPLQLTVHNLAAGKPTFVDFQVRPSDPKRLWYAFNVLDWPSDSEAQVQDVDGLTYADIGGADGNDAYGDMKLVPMLEIRIAGAPTNLPTQADLTPYNVTVNNFTADGNTKLAYVPLNVVTDEQTGQRVAFSGRMRYLPTGNWPTPHDVRLVWVVQTLNDLPCDKTAPDATPDCLADGYINNVGQAIQTYYDEFTVTGLNVQEENGADLAILYEDPAVDSNKKDDTALATLSHGLDNSFLGGRDQDNNSQRDLDLNEIVRRFERTGNSGVSTVERWSVPNTLRVEKQSYPTLDHALITTAVTETKRILNNVFASHWQADKTIKPLLMVAQEHKSRGLDLDSTRRSGNYVTATNGALVFDFAPGGQPAEPVNVLASLKWTPFCAPNAATPVWSACATDMYWNELDARYRAGAISEDPVDADVAEGRLATAQLYFLTLINGVSRIVAQDTRVVSSRYSLKTDAQTEADVRKGVTLGAIAVKYVLSEALTARYVNKTALLKHLGNQLQALRSGAVAQLGGDAIAILRAFRSGGHINRLVGTAIVAGAVVAIGGIVTGAVFLGEAKFSSDPQANLGAKITIRILTDALGLVFSTVLPIVGAVQWINTAKAAGQSFGALSVMNAAASKVAVVGTIIAAGITWGFFIYSMVENKVSAFSPGFNRAFAEAIATTVFLIFLFIFSFTLIGTIIVAIVAAIDAILIAICELGVDELRTVPGLGGACFSLGTSAVKVLAYLFYNFDLMVDTGRSDLVVTGAPDVQLADPSKGYVAGQTIRIGLPITTTVVHKDPDPANGLYIYPYLWLYSSDSLRNNTFRYSLTTQPETINAEGGSMRNVWVGLAEDHKFVQTPMYRVHNFTNPTPVSGIPLQVGLNQAAAFQLNMGYAVVAYECWGIPNLAPPFIPPIIPICYRRNDGLVGNNSTPINSLKFDVFPATLDGLMTLGGRANGAYGLDWDVRFPALPDADGDGLLGSAFNGIDPDDSRVDTDNDGLSDAFELERRQAGLAISPILADSDNDGLSDKDEMAFGSNPGITDTDNDGLTDKQEHDGWDVTINGATSFTLRVTSNPNQGDSDADSISDQAERQLALDANPANRLDSENRPYHPNVPNTAPLAVYTKTDDSDGYVRPGASVRYTTTVVASVAMATGVLEVSAPAAILGAPATAALGFDPNTFNTTQTVEQAALLTVAANATGEIGLTSTARTRLAGATGAPWVWDPATTETALGSFAGGKAPRFIAATAATADRQDSYRFAGMASTALTGDNGGLGDIWSFDIPGGSARTLESDTDTTTSPPLADNAALRGTTSPAIACNNAGVCLAVWPEYKNCNTVTINSLKVVSAGSDTNGGIEPVITFGNSTSGEHWLWYWGNGGGTADLHAGDQRGPNAHGFPVTREFCGSAPIYVWESDEPSYEPVGNFSPPAGDFVNRVVSFSGSGHTIELNITIPEKKLHAITGRIIGQDGTIQLANLAVTAATPADEGNSGPVVASDGTNFLVAWQRLATDAREYSPGLTTTVYRTNLITRLFNAQGDPLTGETLLVGDQLDVFRRSVNFSPLTNQRHSLNALDLDWIGARYRLTRRLALGDSISPADVTVEDNGQTFTGEFITARDLDTKGELIADSKVTLETGNGTRANDGHSLTYNPAVNQVLLVYTDAGFLTARTYNGVSTTHTKLVSLRNSRAGNPVAAYHPPTGGYLIGWTDTLPNFTFQYGLYDTNLALIAGSVQGLTWPVAVSSQRGTALACPAPQSAPVVDLRFEEVPAPSGLPTTFVDSSGRGTNATCTGTTCPTAAVTGAPNAPLSDYAVQFDGADDLLTLNRTIRDDFTVALWLKLDATTINRGTLLEGGSTNAELFQFQVDQANTSNPRLRFQSQFSALQTGNILSRNQWTHVVATRQLNGATTLYVNGVQVAQGNLPALPTGGATLTIGAGFKGAIDALQIYPTALSATTVQALYNRTLQSYCVVAGVPSSGNTFRWSRLTLREQDARGGRITASGGLSLIVDADLPTVSIAGLVNNRYMQGGNPVVLMIGGNASDATAGIGKVEVNVNNSGWQAATGDEAWAYALAVTEGAYTIQARATDNANNLSAVSPAVTLIADATAPDLTLNALGSTPKAPQQINAGQWRVALGGTISDPVRAGRAGSGLPTDAVQVLLESQFNQGLPNTWQTATINGNAWSLDYQLAGIADPSGSYTVTVRAMDNVGNRTPETRATLMLDAAGPVPTLRATNHAAGTLGNVIDGPLMLSGQVTETGRSGINELLVSLTPISQAAVYTNVQLLLAFDELAGATFFVDDSGQGHHATCTSAPNCPTLDVGALFPNARSFDSSQSLTVANVPGLNADAATGLSVQAWIATNYATPILQKGSANSGYGLSLNDSGQATWSLPGLVLAGGPRLTSSNAWRHIVGTVDRTTNTANLYVNGERVANAPFSGSLVTANPLLVGNNGSTGYRGLLDQVAVFQRTLSAAEVSVLYEARYRLLFYATLIPRGGGILTSNWTLSLPAWVPEGQYQIDLRTYDMLGHRGQVINVWRGVVDTQAPRVEMTAQPTGASYFDSSIGMRRNAVRYFCGAQDRHLDAAQFFCPGEAVAQPLSTFQNDPILQQLFPDFTIRSGLAVSYTLWERADSSGAAVIASACDIYGHCAQSSGTSAKAVAGKSEQLAAASDAVSSTPLAVVIAPTDLGYVAADAGSLQVTIAAEAAAGLKDVTLLLDGNPVHTASFAQADNVQSNQTTVAVSVTGEGRHTLVARATDWAGGTQPTDYPVQFTLDTQAPTVTLDTVELTPADTWQMGSGVLRFRGAAGDTIGLAAVKVRVNDGMLADAQFTNGAWQIAYPVQDPEGKTLVVLVRAIDRAGRISEVSRSIPVNLNTANPPQTSFTSATPADPSNSPTVTFAFTGSAPAGLGGFECKIDEGEFVPCGSPWPVSNLSKGAHIFQVRAIDANGFVDPSPADYSWTLNSIGPDATIVNRPPQQTTSRAASFGFSGSGAQSFECSLDGAPFVACTSPQIYNGVTDGEHIFQVRGRSGDQTGTPDRWVWRVTNLSPIAQDQSVTTMQDVAIAITLNAIDEDTLTYQVVDAPAHGVLLGVPPTLTYQPDTNFSGADSFTFRANDGGAPPGPVSNLATVNITVQPAVVTLPETTITVQPTDPSSNADASFEFTGTGGSGSLAGFECRLDTASFIPCTSPQSYTALANGSHTFSVRAVDTAGNVDATPATYIWTVDVAPLDTTAPTSSPTQVPVANAAGWNNSDVIVTWNWTDNSSGSGLDPANCLASSTSSGEGEIALTATCKDLAGNVGTASYTVKVDKSAPDTSITAQPSNPSASSDAQFEFMGSDATAGVVGFECSLDSGAFTACTSPQGYSSLAAGSYSFQVRAIDGAGNIDPSPAAYGWTINPSPVDSTPPVITPQVNGTAGSDGWYVSDVTVTWNVIDAESPISTQTGCDTVTISTDAGGMTLTCSATSSGGPASQSVTIKLDKTLPDTIISAQPANPSTASEAAFTFSGSDNSGVASTECSLDGVTFALCTSPQRYSGLASGDHTFQVRAVDTAGNVDTTPASYTWTITPPPPPAPTILIGSNENGKVGGLSYRDEDIIAYNPNTQQWFMVFDGSDVGLGDSEIDDFALLPGGVLLLSVEKDFTLKGFGPVGDEDLIQFTPTQLGDTTRGSFTLYLDGSTVELDAKNDNEDIKAVELDGSGKLVISTHGTFSAQGVKGENEDLFSLARTPTPVWTWRLDGSDIKLKPDLRALWIDTATDELYVVAEGSFSITGSNGKLSGDGNDIFICRQISFGANTQCELRLFQDMGARGLGKQKIDGLAIGNLPTDFFNISVQTSTIEDDTHEFPGDDADEPALPDSEESEEETEEIHFIYLPVVAR